mmetsp:Transcript_119306/g.382394  ORF Transcript_119306/g.382394 Transcript_119306/m.382394 type:complete len:347 (+) Transcript_119306:1021-2061(+)
MLPVVHANGVLAGREIQAHEGIRVEQVNQDGVELREHILHPNLHERLHPSQPHTLPILLEARVHLRPVTGRRRGWTRVNLWIRLRGNGHIPSELGKVILLVAGEGLCVRLANHLFAIVHDKPILASARWAFAGGNPISLVCAHLDWLDGDFELAAILGLRVDSLPARCDGEFAPDRLRNVLGSACLPAELALHQVAFGSVGVFEPLLAVQVILWDPSTLPKFHCDLFQISQHLGDHKARLQARALGIQHALWDAEGVRVLLPLHLGSDNEPEPSNVLFARATRHLEFSPAAIGYDLHAAAVVAPAASLSPHSPVGPNPREANLRPGGGGGGGGEGKQTALARLMNA